MKAKYGIPIWIGNVFDNIIKKIDTFREFGLDFVELSIDYPWPYKQVDLLEKTVSTIMKNGLLIGVHMPWRDLPFATPYNLIGEAVLSTIREVTEKLRSLTPSLEYILVHPSTMQRIELYDNRRDIINSLRARIETLTETYPDMIIVIENLSKGFAAEISNLIEAVENIDHAGICLDIGHLAARYVKELKDHYDSFYDYLDEVLSMLDGINVPVIHLHDIDEKGREHLLVGEGFLKFKDIYKKISRLEPGYLVYEMFKSRKEKPTIDKILKLVKEQVSWAKIYLH